MDLNVAGNYSNDFVEIQTIYEPHFESSITTSTFDPHQELFWTGNSEVIRALSLAINTFIDSTVICSKY
jgi:hypothetical protein